MSETSRPSKPTGKSSARPSAPGSAAKLPPRVVKKKQNVKRTAVVERPEPGPVDPPSEFVVPLILIGVGLALSVGTSLMLRPESLPLGLWLGIRMGIVVASTVMTFGALFVAAAVLGTEYGFVTNAMLKVSAIVLTQAWVGDLATKIPVPFVDWLVTFGTTYAMFKYFFDLDDMEALASMAVVRLVHWIAIAFIFIAVMSAIMGGKSIDLSLPAGVVAPDEEAPPDDEMDDADLENPK
jgi:hypothetical protein